MPPPTPDETALLALLDEVPPTGNEAVRQQLGWSVVRYEIVKASLLAQGRIAVGHGHGGTIRLAEPEGDTP